MKINIKHIDPEFVDERGGIARVLDQNKYKIQTILRITSKAGTIRSNHYHKKDYHYLYIESGKCEYSEKSAKDDSDPVETVVLHPGDLVLSRPNIIHAVKFVEDSVIYAFSTENRDPDKYEDDTVRITIVE
ncbi:MAG: cupin 2 conserved barrel protein [uncultured bacterium]|nr:MAG: cupin 2 conserved barrel protein [uncultured bacterium]